MRSEPIAGDDHELLMRLAQGDRAALATIQERHGEAAFSLADRICRSRAGEVVDDALLTLWRQTRAGQGAGPVRSRLLAITRQRALARLNDGDCLGARAPRAWDGPSAPSLIGLRDGDAREALKALAPAERQCIEPAYLDGLSIGEIAARTGWPPATVSDRMSRGLDRLHRILVARLLTRASRDIPSFPQ